MPVLEAKKDVFVEWPLGATTAQAEEMAALAKKQGVKNIVDLQARVNPVVQKVKGALLVLSPAGAQCFVRPKKSLNPVLSAASRTLLWSPRCHI